MRELKQRAGWLRCGAVVQRFGLRSGIGGQVLRRPSNQIEPGPSPLKWAVRPSAASEPVVAVGAVQVPALWCSLQVLAGALRRLLQPFAVALLQALRVAAVVVRGKGLVAVARIVAVERLLSHPPPNISLHVTSQSCALGRT